jgi:hypothetical protein
MIAADATRIWYSQLFMQILKIVTDAVTGVRSSE